MPDAFFASDKKRKRSRAGASRGGSAGRGRGRGGSSTGGSGLPRVSRERVQAARDEELDSDDEALGGGDIDDMDFQRDRGDEALSDDEFVDANETAAEKRVRLARGYLDKVAQEVAAEQAEADYDAEEIDRELIASRLRQEVDEAEGRIHRFYASAVPTSTRLKTTKNVPTGVALTTCTPGASAFVSTKSEILRFNRKTLKPTPVVPAAGEEGGHKGPVLAVAASEDGKWLVTGGQDKMVGVWDVSGEKSKWVAGMRGHKDAVTSVVFPPLSNPSAHVLSASLSRHLTLHSLSTLSAIDTFFGHQDSIPSVSALKPTAAATAGSRDRTCRWWKVEEEVQLVLRGGGRMRTDADTPGGHALAPGTTFVEGSIDVVCVLDDSHFVSGGDSGTLALWSTGKKKPTFSRAFAHGLDDEGHGNLLPTDASASASPRWITALAAIRGTNLFASGSWDGRIRFWALDEGLKAFSPAGEVPVTGFINAIQMLANPGGESAALAAAVGREPRLGRWLALKGVANGLFTAELALSKEPPAAAEEGMDDHDA